MSTADIITLSAHRIDVAAGVRPRTSAAALPVSRQKADEHIKAALSALVEVTQLQRLLAHDTAGNAHALADACTKARLILGEAALCLHTHAGNLVSPKG